MYIEREQVEQLVELISELKAKGEEFVNLGDLEYLLPQIFELEKSRATGTNDYTS